MTSLLRITRVNLYVIMAAAVQVANGLEGLLQELIRLRGGGWLIGRKRRQVRVGEYKNN